MLITYFIGFLIKISIIGAKGDWIGNRKYWRTKKRIFGVTGIKLKILRNYRKSTRKISRITEKIIRRIIKIIRRRIEKKRRIIIKKAGRVRILIDLRKRKRKRKIKIKELILRVN